MIITAPVNLSGGQSGPSIPVLLLATFYVTGWDGGAGSGTGCQNEPYPGTGSQKFAVWGHWIKYAVPSGAGTGTGEKCKADEFGDCIAVLTR